MPFIPFGYLVLSYGATWLFIEVLSAWNADGLRHISWPSLSIGGLVTTAGIVAVA